MNNALKLLAISTLGLSVHISALAQDSFGVLVMAHGGIDEWEQGVLDTVQPLQQDYPLEVAFGMADAYSLQEAVSKLEARGVNDIAVVRLFISGESWYERTSQILGLQEGAPLRPATEPMHSHQTAEHGSHADHSETQDAPTHRMEFWKISSDANFVLSEEGLADAEEMTQVLLGRAQGLSQNPAKEDVLILAHGPEDDAENARWIQAITERASPVLEYGFNRVKVTSLREDWEEKREAAEQQVRDFVSTATAEGRTAIVIPYRVHGFGPYADVLEGLDYRADEKGLIPHEGVSEWIDSQARALKPKLADS
ncbi:MAG: CbiX/SirB N-terminal domain-containing protein [Pseudohongiellaceae bacterium]|nr:CbiX/SirB N-terminal domain-containing protein [Pseudohongiellaceae bacterium]